MTGKLRTAMMATALVLGMTGLGWASVPLYRAFCQVTGINGTTNRGTEAPGAIGQTVRVDFDSNIAPGMPWRFRPEQSSLTTEIGARKMAFFVAKNLSDKPVKGQATFNVTPGQAGQYFTKIECFCFTEQTLQPGEEVRMPVIYYVDPKLASDKDTADVKVITLSYTFYPVES